MADDWAWFFSSEAGRDRILRSEIEGLQAYASSTASQSARLDSQLRTLQGSIETRLQALSTAFDAYVELGDVREQLAGFPDSSAVRRDALRAIEELNRGVDARPVDGRGLDYWLADAVDEVIDVVAGREHRRSEATPSAPGGEAELFVVAAAAALGKGPLVAARVPPLLVTDGALSPEQVVLWRAVRDGVFGDVLDEVVAAWAPALDLTAATWCGWVDKSARSSGPLESVRWIDTFLRGEPPSVPPASSAVPDALAAGFAEPNAGASGADTSTSRTGTTPATGTATATGDPRLDPMRAVVRELVDRGDGQERALLERARLLRARIESPTLVAPPGPDDVVKSGPTVILVVQETLLDAGAEPDQRRRLIAAVRPGLAAAATAFGVPVVVSPNTPVRTPMGEIQVGPGGADPRRLAEMEASTTAEYATPRSALLVPGVAAGALLVLGLVLLPTQVVVLGVLALVGAVVAGVVLLRRVLEKRNQQVALTQLLGRTREQLANARTSAEAARRVRAEEQAEIATLVREISTAPAIVAGRELAGPR